jgi:hypothetical protein
MAVKTFTSATLSSSDTNTYLANSGLVYIKQQTIGNGVATQAVTSAFSADYDSYRIVVSGGTASALGSMRMQLGSANSLYYGIVNYATYGAASTPLSAGDNNAALWGYVGYCSPRYLAASIDLINPFDSNKYTSYLAAGWTAETAAGTASGLQQQQASYTAFTLSPQTGTFTGGTIFVYGYRKA